MWDFLHKQPCHVTKPKKPRFRKTKQVTPSVGKDREQQERSPTTVGVQNGAAPLEDSSVVSCKTKHFPDDLAIVLLNINSKELKAHVHSKPCI